MASGAPSGSTCRILGWAFKIERSAPSKAFHWQNAMIFSKQALQAALNFFSLCSLRVGVEQAYAKLKDWWDTEGTGRQWLRLGLCFDAFVTCFAFSIFIVNTHEPQDLRRFHGFR